MIELYNPPIKLESSMVISAVPALIYNKVILKYVSRNTSYLLVRLAFHLHCTAHQITLQR